jgi:pyridoxine 5-phosphate synthase
MSFLQPSGTIIDLGVNIDHVATCAMRAAPVSRSDPRRTAGRAGRRRLHHAAPARRPPPHQGCRRDRAGAAAADPHEPGSRRHAGDDRLRLPIKPADVCLVPEKRTEVTTEGGLDVVGTTRRLKRP